MAAPSLVTITLFILNRFPFLNALTLLMLLGERASTEKYPPIPPRVIYVNIFLFAVSGAMMSARVWRKQAALLYAGQLGYFAYNMMANPQMKYNQFQRMRFTGRLVGCIGTYMLLAYLFDNRKSESLRKLGEKVMAGGLMLTVYAYNNSNEDIAAFSYHFPGGHAARYIISIIYGASAICFLCGYFVSDMSVTMAVMMSLVTVILDCDMNYWTHNRGVHMWNQIRLISDSICLIIGFVLVWKKLDNNLPDIPGDETSSNSESDSKQKQKVK